MLLGVSPHGFPRPEVHKAPLRDLRIVGARVGVVDIDVRSGGLGGAALRVVLVAVGHHVVGVDAAAGGGDARVHAGAGRARAPVVALVRDARLVAVQDDAGDWSEVSWEAE